MNTILENIKAKIDELEAELEHEIEESRKKFGYNLEEKKVKFEEAVLAQQRKWREGLPRYIINARFIHLLIAPVIYSLILPLVLLDIFITLYQWICFPVYGVKPVKRSEHIVIDRQYLPYLNLIQKINCVYCGYGNGVLSYAREIAGITEKFWCPIKHAHKTKEPHQKYYEFIEYGDGENYKERLHHIRAKIGEIETLSDDKKSEEIKPD